MGRELGDKILHKSTQTDSPLLTSSCVYIRSHLPYSDDGMSCDPLGKTTIQNRGHMCVRSEASY